MVTFENPMGTIKIDQSYFSQLIGSVVPTCFGVVGMASSNTSQQLRSFFHRKRLFLDQGVCVKGTQDGLEIELHIVVKYGVNISAVVESIVNKVRYTIETATGLNVKDVTVYVDSMIS